MRPTLTLVSPACGFSLIEIVITIAIVSIVFLGTFTLINTANRYNTMEQERSHAQVVAVQQMERLRQTPYTSLAPYTQNVRIWDGGTPNDTTDDTQGQVQFIMRNTAGTALTAAPATHQILTAEITVTWSPRGMRNARQQQETLMTMVTP